MDQQFCIQKVGILRHLSKWRCQLNSFYVSMDTRQMAKHTFLFASLQILKTMEQWEAIAECGKMGNDKNMF